jgi:hypothetical protein
MGTAVMFIDDGQEEAVYSQQKILVTKSTRLLLLAIQMREEEVEGYIFKPNKTSKGVVRNSMHRAADLV